jgi:lipoate-protein ligase A
VFPPADGATNFARDEALLDAARQSGETLIRVYTWSTPTLSFGRHERTAGTYEPELVEASGLAAVRRPTGGRALVHDRELTYAIAAPAPAGEPLATSFAFLSDVLVTALHALGVHGAAIADTRSTARPSGAPCFAEASRGEIVVGGRKLVASAQWRPADAYLQHGSIPIEDDQQRLRAFLNDDALISAPATLRALLDRIPGTDEFGSALANAYETHTGVRAERVAPDRMLDEERVRAHIGRYRDPEWTWRK